MPSITGIYLKIANMDEFQTLLTQSGYTKANLGRALGINPTTPSKWREAPEYVLAYLRVYVELKSLKSQLRALGNET